MDGPARSVLRGTYRTTKLSGTKGFRLANPTPLVPRYSTGWYRYIVAIVVFLGSSVEYHQINCDQVNPPTRGKRTLGVLCPAG